MLSEAARQAFGYGLHVVFAICAILTLAAAATATTLLRDVHPSEQPSPSEVRDNTEPPGNL